MTLKSNLIVPQLKKEKMRKKILFFILSLIIVSCSFDENDYTTVTFSQLEPLLQDTLIQLHEKYDNYFVEIMDEHGNIINESESHFNEMIDLTDRFEYQSKQHWLLKWVYSPVVIEKATGKKMTFEKRTPEPFLITDSCLYIPTRYDILNDKLEATKFRKYLLK